MASESVKILIEAEDLASQKIATAAQSVEKNVKAIKTIGGQAKASTEFIGQLAGTLGGSEIAGIAQQMGGLTEKVSQFAEVSKAGGAGALAFKAGLVGLAGVVGFEVGKAIGDAVFQTEKWNRELEEAHRLSGELTDALIRQQEFQRSIQLREIALLPKDDQAAAQADMLDKLRNDLAKFKEQRKESLQAIVDQEKSLSLSNFISSQSKGVWGGLTDFAADNVSAAFAKATGSIDQTKDKLQEADKQIASLTRDVESLSRATSQTEIQTGASEEEKRRSDAAKAFIQGLQQQNSLLSAQGDELYQLKAEMAGLVGEEQKRAIELMKQADLEKQRQDLAKMAAKEAEAAIARDIAAKEKSNQVLQSELQRLEERKLLIEQGESAVKAFRLAQQGVGQDAVKALIEAEEKLSQAEAAKQKAANPVRPTESTPALQAFQSRMLTRGPSQAEPMKAVERNTADANKLLAEVSRLMEQVAEATKKTAEKKTTEFIEVR
jgi:hypothetical protein